MIRIFKLLKCFSEIYLLALFLFIFQFISAAAETGEDSHRRLEMGKRLFYGLTAPDKINCASCHNTNVIDTLNWNPSALAIAQLTKNMDSTAFASSILSPVTPKATESHADIELTGEEIILIRNYLNDIMAKGLTPQKPVITELLIFIGLIGLFLLAFADLTLFKKIKWRAIPILIILFSTVWVTKMIAEEAINLGRSEGYAPLQPIKFSHKVHVEENQIDCQYCHHLADHSKSAGIPGSNVCLNCHELVREGTHSGRFEINKIHAAVDSGMPVEWIRVHRLPDFVYFNHAQHVEVGNIDCQECHGAVEEMHVLEQYSDLSMGWCLDCHRSRGVEFTENDYYGMTFEKYHEQIVSGEMDSVLVDQVGGSNCMKCHY